MTFENFCHLDSSQQMNILYKHGVYVGKRKVESITLLMYQLYYFYVEIVFIRYRTKIASVYATKDVEILTPYLEQIDVQELITTCK